MFFDGTPHPTWDMVPVAVGKERYDLGEISQDSVYLEDQFGEEPEYFFVHRGDVTVNGSLVLQDDFGEEITTLYVIDGDLTVNGPASSRNADSNTSLYVTGSVTVQDLVCLGHSQLFIGGTLAVKNLLFTDLADAGHLVVHGSVSALTWIEAAGRGAIYFPAPPTARLLGSAHNRYFGATTARERIEDAVLAEFLDADDRLDRRKTEQAVLDGRLVLR
jgi:hypothetical protein